MVCSFCFKKKCLRCCAQPLFRSPWTSPPGFVEVYWDVLSICFEIEWMNISASIEPRTGALLHPFSRSPSILTQNCSTSLPQRRSPCRGHQVWNLVLVFGAVICQVARIGSWKVKSSIMFSEMVLHGTFKEIDHSGIVQCPVRWGIRCRILVSIHRSDHRESKFALGF